MGRTRVIFLSSLFSILLLFVHILFLDSELSFEFRFNLFINLMVMRTVIGTPVIRFRVICQRGAKRKVRLSLLCGA